MPESRHDIGNQGTGSTARLSRRRDAHVYIVTKPAIGANVPMVKHLLDRLAEFTFKNVNVGEAIPASLPAGIVAIESKPTQNAGSFRQEPCHIVFAARCECSHLKIDQSVQAYSG